MFLLFLNLKKKKNLKRWLWLAPLKPATDSWIIICDDAVIYQQSVQHSYLNHKSFVLSSVRSCYKQLCIIFSSQLESKLLSWFAFVCFKSIYFSDTVTHKVQYNLSQAYRVTGGSWQKKRFVKIWLEAHNEVILHLNRCDVLRLCGSVFEVTQHNISSGGGVHFWLKSQKSVCVTTAKTLESNDQTNIFVFHDG